MFEANNGSVLVPDLTSAINIIEEKERKIASLEAYIETQRGIIKMHAETIEKTGELIKPLLEDETIEPTSQLGSDLIDLLNIDLTKEIEITVTMTWNVTATIPSHYDAQDWANEQDWSAEFDETIALFNYVSTPDIEVEADDN